MDLQYTGKLINDPLSESFHEMEVFSLIESALQNWEIRWGCLDTRAKGPDAPSTRKWPTAERGGSPFYCDRREVA